MRAAIMSSKIALFLVAFAGLTGSDSLTADPEPKLPPDSVTVSNPLVRTVTDYDEFRGQISAVETIELRARVQGHLTRIQFRDGQLVKAGDLLFEIDPRTYQATLDIANAQVAAADAAFKLAKSDHARLAMLFDKRVIPQNEVTSSEGKVATAAAELQKAEAVRQKARLDLEMTRVMAPRDGRIGRAQVPVGSLINPQGSNTLLATIVSIDPVHVNFNLDEGALLRLHRRLRQPAREVTIPLFVGLAGEQGFPHEAALDFIDNRVDPATGTIQMRGRVANPQMIFWSGMQARVRIAARDPYEALLITTQAVRTDGDQKFVYVVNDKNVAIRRNVELGRSFDGFVTVVRGLTAGDLVIVAATRRVTEGREVRVEKGAMPKAESHPKPLSLGSESK